MDSLTVSIIIPAYNAQAHLRACVESVLKQSCPFLELIIVDNHSTDKTKELILGFARKDARVRYIFEGQKSRGAARNAGIREARGGLIAMVDSDCTAPEDWLEGLIRPIVEEGEQIVMGWEQPSANNACTVFIQEQNKRFLHQYRQGEHISTLDTKNCAFRAEILKKYNFDPAIGNLEDCESALRLRGKYQIRFLDGVRVQHSHKTSAWEWMKLQFNRGYWARQIYKKHKGSEVMGHEVMFESLKPLNMLTFPAWMAVQFLIRRRTHCSSFRKKVI